MTTKQQLQNKIEELETQLNEFKQQLNNFRECPKIENAGRGDVLEDGSVVIWSDNGMALLMAPAMTEVCCHWEKDFENVFDYLDNFSFRPCDWFIPSVKHLVFALEQVPEQFSIGSYYWTSDSYDKFTKMVLIVSGLGSGTFMPYNPSNNYRVRAFRFVMY